MRLPKHHENRCDDRSGVELTGNSGFDEIFAAADGIMIVERALEVAPCDAVLVPTRDGTAARAVARWRSPVWVVATGPEPAAMQGSAFSYGAHPVDLEEEPHDWRGYVERLLLELGHPCKQVLLVAGAITSESGSQPAIGAHGFRGEPQATRLQTSPYKQAPNLTAPTERTPSSNSASNG